MFKAQALNLFILSNKFDEKSNLKSIKIIFIRFFRSFIIKIDSLIKEKIKMQLLYLIEKKFSWLERQVHSCRSN